VTCSFAIILALLISLAQFPYIREEAEDGLTSWKQQEVSNRAKFPFDSVPHGHDREILTGWPRALFLSFFAFFVLAAATFEIVAPSLRFQRRPEP
jgi:hypothetical protein